MAASGRIVWVGRVISVLAALVFLMSAFMQIALGILVWLGLYLRERRLKELIPLRTR